ncbi:hypothetical protein V8E54_009870 [Elaphomyces granulatus]
MSYIIHEEYSRSRQGASFFRAHFVAELDADWKEVFRGSNILSWKQDDDKGSRGAQSDYEPSYRVELDVDDDTASALRALCDSSPLGDADGVHYPIVGRTAVFSTKLRSLQRNDTLQVRLTVNDPFPYLYHEEPYFSRECSRTLDLI